MNAGNVIDLRNDGGGLDHSLAVKRLMGSVPSDTMMHGVLRKISEDWKLRKTILDTRDACNMSLVDCSDFLGAPTQEFLKYVLKAVNEVSGPHHLGFTSKEESLVFPILAWDC